ncbi:hypothetical protein E4U55_002328 [Claviceps digitariae]|nr:hypothetical protein E4U55_002328 [Claviceps digitariae]
MLLQSSYLTYKRETSRLVFLLVTASNAILSVKNVKAKLNTSGKLDSSGFVPSAELIRQHMRSVPCEILRLLKSVIELRTSHYAEFQRRVSANPNFKTEESNKSHKHFIDVLSRAFDILGGEDGLKKQNIDKMEADNKEISDQDFQANCSNIFARLHLHDTDSNGEEEDDDDDEVADETTSGIGHARKVRSRPAKSKKGKSSHGKNPANKKQKHRKHLGAFSIETYGILDDDHHVAAEYFLAVSSFLEQCIDLRLHCQTAWYKMAYNDWQLLEAVATSAQSIAMVKRSHATICNDFPGSHAYMSLINTYTRGGVNNLQQNTTIRVSCQPKSEATCVSVAETVVSRDFMKELLMEPTYNDLVEFLKDFQKTSSGAPTKPMQAEISQWDPKYDLEAATADQRLQWRRIYAINWLYGLVGYYLTSKKEIDNVGTKSKSRHSSRTTAAIPWAEDYSFFGLGEFARSIISLARRPAGSHMENIISPCLVFQLQCIVDSFTVSRGWLVDVQQHILQAPPAEDNQIWERGALAWFNRLTCANKCENHQGLSRSSEWLTGLHSSSLTRHGSFGRYTLAEVWTSWIFHHRFIVDLRNGNAPDFRTGVLKEPVDLMAKLTIWFMRDFFGEKPPTSDFYQTFINRKGSSRYSTNSLLRPFLISTPSYKQFHMNERLFKTRSSFLVFHEAGWETVAVSPLRNASLNELARLRTVISDLGDRSSFDNRKRCAKMATPGHDIDLPHFDPDSEHIHESLVLSFCNYALERDLCVCCPAPLSGVNFLAVTAKLLSIWIAIGEKLKLSGYVPSDGVESTTSSPIESIVATALQENDDNLNKLLAEVFEETRAKIESLSYFTIPDEKKRANKNDNDKAGGESS